MSTLLLLLEQIPAPPNSYHASERIPATRAQAALLWPQFLVTPISRQFLAVTYTKASQIWSKRLIKMAALPKDKLVKNRAEERPDTANKLVWHAPEIVFLDASEALGKTFTSDPESGLAYGPS